MHRSKLKTIYTEKRPMIVGQFVTLTYTYFKPCSSVSIIDFEQVNKGWVRNFMIGKFLGNFQRIQPKLCVEKLSSFVFNEHKKNFKN